jgi:hypothetical protein
LETDVSVSQEREDFVDIGTAYWRIQIVCDIQILNCLQKFHQKEVENSNRKFGVSGCEK